MWETSLLRAVSRVQSLYIARAEQQELFAELLSAFLDTLESEYGFIGEIFEEEGHPFLRTHALTNISWDEDTRRLYEESKRTGLEFRNLNSLFGRVIVTGEPFVCNDPANHPARAGLPKGHPALNSFLGMPLKLGDTLIGMVGVANRPGGYEMEHATRLQPLLGTCAQLIAAYGIEQRRREAEEKLVAAREAAEAAVKVKSQFLANMSHEMRTPLNGILGVTDLIAQTPLSDEQGEYVTTIRQSGEALLAVINDILEFSKNEHLKLVLEERPFDLLPLLEEVCDECSVTAHGKGIELSLHVDRRVPLRVDGDRFRLRQVLVNLVGNAVKFTAEGHVTVMVYPEEEGPAEGAGGPAATAAAAVAQPALPTPPPRPRHARPHIHRPSVSPAGPCPFQRPAMSPCPSPPPVSCYPFSAPAPGHSSHSPPPPELRTLSLRFVVEDSGPGIPEESRSKLFQPFSQVDSSATRRFGGTGLGLAIARQIVGSMAGSIWCEGMPGGARFVFTARFRPAEAPPAPGPQRVLAVSPRPGARLLTFGLAERSRAALAELLAVQEGSGAGSEVVAAASDDEAAALLQEGSPFAAFLVQFEGEAALPAAALAAAARRGVQRVLALRVPERRLAARLLEGGLFEGHLVRPIKAARLAAALRSSSSRAPGSGPAPPSASSSEGDLQAAARCPQGGKRKRSSPPGGDEAGPGARPPRAPPAPNGLVRAAAASASAAASAAAVVPDAPVPPQPRILVAEDHPVNRAVVLKMLSKLGYGAVEHAEDGQEAVALCAAAHYDIVFMDVCMPRMDGLQATRAIRGLAGEGRPPSFICAMTAEALTGDRERCLAAGMDHYIAKPVRQADLVAAIRQALRPAAPASPANSSAADSEEAAPAGPGPAGPAGPVTAAA